ncbi:hypothetical protein OH76DRAFT_1006633 [Lentinus brumalis]|uniref:Phosphatidylglycerol/phosphatidylinositol transfer protein n=1 Tax=Lentinus brumalis TaxID=2498619 RepID=A0A371CYQ4_9APHY|nr:hypothetical protein OH76DRAFT_1006633 [Polyporus brumalis]
MKTFIVLASLALSALAQQAVIVSPVNGSDITAGSTLVVDVHQANSATSQVQVAVVLGLSPCLTGPCGTPGDPGVGTILFKGEFHPQSDPSAPANHHQTFTVQVPQSAPTGASILSLTHLQMIGAIAQANLQTNGIVVNVV